MAFLALERNNRGGIYIAIVGFLHCFFSSGGGGPYEVCVCVCVPVVIGLHYV